MLANWSDKGPAVTEELDLDATEGRGLRDKQT